MRKELLLIFLLLCCTFSGKAQVTTTPVFIAKGYTGEITITFNPQEGNKGMATAKTCYAHTGLITSASKTDSDWKYATAQWRGNDTKYKMTKVGTNWQLVIPNINEYYGCPQDEEILKMAFVFHDGPNGSLEGKTAGGGDIFVELVDPGLVAKILSPSDENILLSAGETLEFNCVSSEDARLSLRVNEEEVYVTQGMSLQHSITFKEQGDFTVTFTAGNATEEKSVSISVSVMRATEERTRPAGKEEMGIYYDDNDLTRVTLCTYAAGKTAPAKAVYVVGDFNDWTLQADYQMFRDGNHFWIEIENLEPGKEYAYQYWVVRADGQMKKISDAYSTKVLHPDDSYEPKQIDPTLMPYPKKGEGYVSVLQTGKPAFEWSDATLNFKRPNKNNLIIYELWVYDYTPERSIEGVRRRLDYLQNLGVNAIELMPICEFEGNYNWGYSPTHYFAPDKAYGTETQIKTFIDECHQRGIAVIMDMVFNHATGLNPQNKLYPYGTDLAQNPWFNVSAPHSDNVYEDWNHDFEETRKMFTRALQYWITEFHVDGYRMDLSHGFCGADCNKRMENINHYYTNGVRAAADDAYFILEHWGDKMSSERPALIKNGMLCWQNTNNAYSQTAMGKLTSDSFADANQDGYVTYCESHDEERNFYKAKTEGIDIIKQDEQVRLSRVPLNMAFNLLLNGSQMIWQWNELGFDYSINSTKGSTTINNNNRCSIKEQPETLGWLKEGLRMEQYRKVAQLIQLRTRLAPSVFIGDPTSVSITSGLEVRTIVWGTGSDAIFVVGNFSATDTKTVRLPEGTWYDYFYQTPQKVGVIGLMPGELRIFTARPFTLPEVPVSYDFTTDLPLVNAGGENITVYPTLTNGVVYLSEQANVTVYNLSGQAIATLSNVKRLNLSGADNGIYLLIIEQNGKRNTCKIIKY
ncbi:MAG: alpha-amylase family glycosyl hydrolase [Paludibacter sp.]|nr:alpha-amylase family glycosyl hydrolase [Bacteroidales bacterium]MCM1069270.1 alpha-amylase family glycosyl hydrolase [Prevotella sp.]MCM1353747.1 alpha-amylase family glycosyl hydrolase [Bacteroides sp.]MCM1442185.1 alpha-amylase family glycosyl hydrolase [Muribaculum sp.]MCM1482147.1 alpha-amylase family glycosyl hydrolase [Paludibacter sp.]